MANRSGRDRLAVGDLQSAAHPLLPLKQELFQ